MLEDCKAVNILYEMIIIWDKLLEITIFFFFFLVRKTL